MTEEIIESRRPDDDPRYSARFQIPLNSWSPPPGVPKLLFVAFSHLACTWSASKEETQYPVENPPNPPVYSSQGQSPLGNLDSGTCEGERKYAASMWPRSGRVVASAAVLLCAAKRGDTHTTFNSSGCINPDSPTSYPNCNLLASTLSVCKAATPVSAALHCYCQPQVLSAVFK